MSANRINTFKVEIRPLFGVEVERRRENLLLLLLLLAALLISLRTRGGAVSLLFLGRGLFEREILNVVLLSRLPAALQGTKFWTKIRYKMSRNIWNVWIS